MGLEELERRVEDERERLGDEVAVELDGETRETLAFLSAVLEPESVDELVRRAVNDYFRTNLSNSTLDLHLRNHGVTYEEVVVGREADTDAGGVGELRDDTGFL